MQAWCRKLYPHYSLSSIVWNLDSKRLTTRGVIDSWRLGKGFICPTPGWEAGASEKEDSVQLCCDRMAVKTAYLAEQTTAWTTPPNKNSEEVGNKKIPVAVMIPYRVRNRVGAENILRLRNWRIDRASRNWSQTNIQWIPERSKREKMIRLCLEFCPFGDVEDVIFHSGNSYQQH
ncbi:hypothetical protein K470DRAFT_114388 [Piedraia hortae CBS 480.64]|uniref:Uncharacterized protein n=1 Tax=Piedraia hortae CBS 480.64 TaxID=1314780 RepID=A0A6A7BUS2_9PEZI|nr:hypothetical protein K470DRAFT_114388 [Piedraia hortae CBS 480.64]